MAGRLGALNLAGVALGGVVFWPFFAGRWHSYVADPDRVAIAGRGVV